MARGKGSGPDFRTILRWPSWALAIWAFASAFTPMGHDLMLGLRWTLCLSGILFAGLAMGEGRRVPMFLYGLIALLVNPFRPFHFTPEVLRLVLAAAGIWLVADHLPGRE